MSPNFFLAGISWAQDFFLSVFRGYKRFSLGYFVGPIFFLGLISWIKDFQLLTVLETVKENWNTQKHLKLCILFQIDFNNCQDFFVLKRDIIYQISYTITELSFVLSVFFVISFLQH